MSNVSRWNGIDTSAISSVSKSNWSISIKAKTIRLPFSHFYLHIKYHKLNEKMKEIMSQSEEMVRKIFSVFFLFMLYSMEIVKVST